MDWKAYYREELVQPDARGDLERALRLASGKRSLDALLDQKAILSFPHTAARCAAPLQAQVVTTLERRQPRLVIALGVLHLSEIVSYRVARDQAATSHRRAEAVAHLTGGLIPVEDRVETPFGVLELEPAPREVPETLRYDRDGILKGEFSLDLFLALVRLQANVQRVPPLRVIVLYVGLTRDPETGSFDGAKRLALAVKDLAGPDTAIVTTGDLVHFGHHYDPQARIESMPADPDALTALFRRETEDVLDLALVVGDHAAAFERGERFLHSDQRFVLPVVAGLLGPGVRSNILEFELSDYSSILGVEPPSLVASALVAYSPCALEKSEAPCGASSASLECL